MKEKGDRQKPLIPDIEWATAQVRLLMAGLRLRDEEQITIIMGNIEKERGHEEAMNALFFASEKLMREEDWMWADPRIDSGPDDKLK